ncbi:MAG: LysM peptidoglycan-binding domain-containing protein, partial [Longimicrobiales bacterium]
SYNTGENRVDRILKERKNGARGDDSLFWEIARYLPQETRDYVPLMLAAGHIAKQPAEFGFTGLNYQDPLAFETVWVPGASSFEMVAKAAGVTPDEIAELNPHLIKETTPPGRGWGIRIPEGTHDRFSARFPELFRTARLALAKAKAAGTSHRVRSGETLSHLADRYDVSVEAIRRANGNISPRRVRAGQVLAIPGVSVASATASADEDAMRYHKVSPGENLTTIGRRYDLTVRELQSLNRMGSRSKIIAGESLRVS